MNNTFKIRSRIHENFSKDLIKELEKICKTPSGSNNDKIDSIIDLLSDNIVFDEIGTGTNRLAIKIENYVYKIALDRRGIIDNDNEFTLTEELQPHVIKTYETNGIISVCEYVRGIESKEEFEKYTSTIAKTLSKISTNGYLLGDVGINMNNFCNWGFREDGRLVILDFAYIYRIKKAETFCVRCGKPIQYDSNFINLYCTGCSAKYTFVDLRSQITMEEEKADQNVAKEFAFKLTEAIKEYADRSEYKKEGSGMDASMNNKNIADQNSIGYTPVEEADIKNLIGYEGSQGFNALDEDEDIDIDELYLKGLDAVANTEMVYIEEGEECEEGYDNDNSSLVESPYPNNNIGYDENDIEPSFDDVDDIVSFMNNIEDDCEGSAPEAIIHVIDDTTDDDPVYIADMPLNPHQNIEDGMNTIYSMQIPISTETLSLDAMVDIAKNAGVINDTPSDDIEQVESPEIPIEENVEESAIPIEIESPIVEEVNDIHNIENIPPPSDSGLEVSDEEIDSVADNELKFKVNKSKPKDDVFTIQI